MDRAKTLLFVWWSMTGGTRALVDAAAAAAREAVREPDASAPVEIAVKRCDQASAEDLLRAAGYVFATPENLATMAGMMKDFFDRTYYPALERINGRPYAAIICAGSDGQGAARQIERIATGWRLKRIAETLIVITHAQTPEAILAPKRIAQPDLERASEMGAAIAAGLALGIF